MGVLIIVLIIALGIFVYMGVETVIFYHRATGQWPVVTWFVVLALAAIIILSVGLLS